MPTIGRPGRVKQTYPNGFKLENESQLDDHRPLDRPVHREPRVKNPMTAAKTALAHADFEVIEDTSFKPSDDPDDTERRRIVFMKSLMGSWHKTMYLFRFDLNVVESSYKDGSVPEIYVHGLNDLIYQANTIIDDLREVLRTGGLDVEIEYSSLLHGRTLGNIAGDLSIKRRLREAKLMLSRLGSFPLLTIRDLPPAPLLSIQVSSNRSLGGRIVFRKKSQRLPLNNGGW